MDHNDVARGRRRAGRPAGRGVDGNTLRTVAGAIGVALLAVGGTLAFTQGRTTQPAADPCGTRPVTLAASPDLAPALTAALAEAGCQQVSVQARTSSDVLRSLVSGIGATDYWVPDSSLWLARAASLTQAQAPVVVDSLATTPVVLASTTTAGPQTWADVLADPGLVMGDPLTSTVAGVPLLLGDATAPSTAARIAALAQAAVATTPPDDRARVQGLAALAGMSTAEDAATPATEQAVLSEGAGLHASVPGPGTILLDYPLVLTAPAARSAELADLSAWLGRFAGSDELSAALADAHFRPVSGARIEGGVGEVEPVPAPAAEQVTTLLGAWAALATPIRALAAVDVSASMDFPARTGTRIDVTVAAMQAGLDLFPDSASVGVWAFAERLDGNRDHRELVPIRRLADPVGSGTQRTALATAVEGLPRLTTGGTGLYDTVLAAYTSLTRDYDPGAVNSLLLFTDGANDDPGSITQAQLIRRLEELADPQRPVLIIAIGITADADADALARIATAVGGFSMIAEQPEDMTDLFARAMAARL